MARATGPNNGTTPQRRRDRALAATREVCKKYGYSAFVVDKGKRLDAITTIAGLKSNTTWGTPIATRNVLFL